MGGVAAGSGLGYPGVLVRGGGLGSALDRAPGAGLLTMLGRLMKYEWRNLSADGAPLAVALLLGAAIAYGAFNGSQWVRFQQRTIGAALAEERARLDGIRAEIPKVESGELKVSAFADPRLPQSFGRNMGLRYAVMPPAALGALAIGQSDLYPYYFKVSTGSKETFINSDEIENPVHLLAGRFDLAFVILYLFPLVILAFSYNLISAEKEAGTLALTLSQPVTLRKVVMAKVTLRALFVVALAAILSILEKSTSPEPRGPAGAVESFVGRIIHIESANRCDARNPLSTAVGLGQFIESTWITTVKIHRPDLFGKFSRGQLLDMRTNCELARSMTSAFTRDNAAVIRQAGHNVTPGNLYLAHFLGVGGAIKVLSNNPNRQIAPLAPARRISRT